MDSVLLQVISFLFSTKHQSPSDIRMKNIDLVIFKRINVFYSLFWKGIRQKTDNNT